MLMYSTILNVREDMTKEKLSGLIQGETAELPDILAVRTEADGGYADFVLNLAEKKLAVRLDSAGGRYSDTGKLLGLLIRNGCLENDRDLPVLQKPVMITDSSQEILKNFLNDRTFYGLPVVYVSRDYHDRLPVDINSLAYRLGGLAHVLAEKSLAECAQCRELCGETPEEFGAVRIYYADADKKRFLFRSSTGDTEERTEKAVRNVVQYWNSHRADILYTWQGVSNEVLMKRLDSQTEKRTAAEKARLNAEAEVSQVYETFDEDIKDLQRKLDSVTRANESLRAENSCLKARIEAADFVPLIVQGEEEGHYPDEVRDVVLEILNNALNGSEKGTRRYDVLEDVLRANPYKHLCEERKQKIKKLFRESKAPTEMMKNELTAMGFQISEDGKHFKLTWKGDSRYMIPIPRTPSDPRSMSNTASDINKRLL